MYKESKIYSVKKSLLSTEMCKVLFFVILHLGEWEKHISYTFRVICLVFKF